MGLPSLKKAKYLVYPGKNRDVKETLRNPIGCLKDWELEKIDKSQKFVDCIVIIFLQGTLAKWAFLLALPY